MSKTLIKIDGSNKVIACWSDLPDSQAVGIQTLEGAIDTKGKIFHKDFNLGDTVTDVTNIVFAVNIPTANDLERTRLRALNPATATVADLFSALKLGGFF